MLDSLISLQDHYTPVGLVVACALVGILALAILRNLPWMSVIVIIWAALWVGAMPAGLDAANLVWDQQGTSNRLHCATQLTQKLGYWTGHVPLKSATDCK